METFSRAQQLVVLLIIFGMTLLYFRSLNMSESQQPGRATLAGHLLHPPVHQFSYPQKPAARQQPPAAKNLTGAQLLTSNKQINLNAATANDLEAIPGIGPATAKRIVGYRKEHGKFNQIEDLLNVTGIKDKKFEKIKRYLTVK